MILVYLRPLPGFGVSIYSTSAILVLAHLGRILPLVLRPVGAAVTALGPSLDEARRIGCGRASPGSRCTPWRRPWGRGRS